jgi:hypothetical protein
MRSLKKDRDAIDKVHKKANKRKSSVFFEGFFDDEDDNSIDDKDNELYSTDAITFSRICHITTEPIDKASVTLDTIDNMLIARGHIIICGVSHNFIDLVKPLRAKHLPKSECPAIVILCKEIPDEKLWSTIAFFDQIYIIQGDPMNKSDLKRAGIRFAKKVVILAPSINEITQFSLNKRKKNSNVIEDYQKTTTARKLTREEEDLLDSKTIFKYNMISKLKKDIFIIVELISPKNVVFLYNKGRIQNDEYKFIKCNMNIDGTAAFAAGEVYYSSIMDNLIIQAYYNPSLLSVLKKLILGEDQSVYKRTPLSKYKDIISSNLYLIEIPNIKKNSSLSNSDLFNENNTGIKLTFGEVFLFLLKKRIIVIGVYRAHITNLPASKLRIPFIGQERKDNEKTNSNIYYYVVTSPDSNYVLNPKDKLFVLSQVFPSEEIFLGETLEKLNKSDDDILKQYENNRFKANKKNEEKKDNLKSDHVGETKIKEVNVGLKETLDSLKDLKNNIIKVRSKLDKTICDSITKKIQDMNKNAVFSETDSA